MMYTYQYKKETKTNPKSDLCVFMYIIGGFFCSYSSPCGM